MSAATVNVSNISSTTTHEQLHEFFSFCGDIKSIDLKREEDSKQSAVITFAKHSAANTALMLNGGTLGGEKLHITSDVQHHNHQEQPERSSAPFDQSDKPRAGIAAEYLAKGYKLSDHILQRAIEIDNKQGISKRFVDYIRGLDTSLGQKALGPEQTVSGKVQSTLKGAQDRAKTIDEQKGYSKVAHEYYSKAISSPFGKSVLDFYTNTSKQVLDIHEEARRMVDQHKDQPTTTSSATSTGATGSDAQPTPTTQAAPTVV
ncbi:hypothetical protein K503DRAFT_865072 [Rhizopogon vinicolor AM-OR11-026]|uniref:RRM domain-containing protein n=1 Tax=Rhizopogon vinicolor AM-OR11-026 TaxID=1314800 RepID=A0A1B7N4U7_9AGAM|nr:hypothetical protein K503DRAFT_865072 [Rhizopogon vinicolor AM-OR11-026]